MANAVSVPGAAGVSFASPLVAMSAFALGPRLPCAGGTTGPLAGGMMAREVEDDERMSSVDI